MEMFPTASATKPKVIRKVETTEEVPIYCACRQPDDGKDMIRCDKSHGWFHRACENVMVDAWGKKPCKIHMQTLLSIKHAVPRPVNLVGI